MYDIVDFGESEFLRDSRARVRREWDLITVIFLLKLLFVSYKSGMNPEQWLMPR